VGRARAVLGVLGELLFTLGLVLLLFCAYELWFTGRYTAAEQQQLESDLDRAWAAPPAPGAPRPTAAGPSPLGSASARIYAPRLGRSWRYVVVEGVWTEDLKKGPGHYPGTAAPGEVGNLVISGHRTTYGAPFNRIDELRVGDAVVLETRTAWVTYRVSGQRAVAPNAVEVTYPVPGRRGERPTERLLTLTTCTPKYSARQRLVVSGVEESSVAKRPGVLPPALSAVG
jgi:sortase A